VTPSEEKPWRGSAWWRFHKVNKFSGHFLKPGMRIRIGMSRNQKAAYNNPIPLFRGDKPFALYKKARDWLLCKAVSNS
jgi:hypothetical protein